MRSWGSMLFSTVKNPMAEGQLRVYFVVVLMRFMTVLPLNIYSAVLELELLIVRLPQCCVCWSLC
jgi:hypothetical protein